MRATTSANVRATILKNRVGLDRHLRNCDTAQDLPALLALELPTPVLCWEFLLGSTLYIVYSPIRRSSTSRSSGEVAISASALSAARRRSMSCYPSSPTGSDGHGFGQPKVEEQTVELT
jgi:hypothetical protein